MTGPDALSLADLEPDAGILDAVTTLGCPRRLLRANIADAAVDLDRALTAGNTSGAALHVREIRAYARALATGRSR